MNENPPKINNLRQYNLVYRIRKKGYVVKTKEKLIFCYRNYLPDEVSFYNEMKLVNRLIDEFNFYLQLKISFL